ncbi:hypothetical protein, partial [Burkholderia pseudomallei]|uniref:hypothetical protein n=1 Tax=Burkholderia pseudomallei TaxID=28450 RepID=UPI0019D47F29
PTSRSPNPTRTDKEIYNRHRATPKPAESVTFPKSAVTFAEIRMNRPTRFRNLRIGVAASRYRKWDAPDSKGIRPPRTNGSAKNQGGSAGDFE